MDSIEQYLGAIFGWVWCKAYREYSYCLLYWPVKNLNSFTKYILDDMPNDYWSGFV